MAASPNVLRHRPGPFLSSHPIRRRSPGTGLKLACAGVLKALRPFPGTCPPSSRNEEGTRKESVVGGTQAFPWSREKNSRDPRTGDGGVARWFTRVEGRP